MRGGDTPLPLPSLAASSRLRSAAHGAQGVTSFTGSSAQLYEQPVLSPCCASFTASSLVALRLWHRSPSAQQRMYRLPPTVTGALPVCCAGPGAAACLRMLTEVFVA